MEIEKRLSIANSKEIKDRFAKEKKLGEGSYGVVYKMYDQIKQMTVAVKKIKLSFDTDKKNMDEEDDEGIPSTTIREISILQKVKHKNLVELKEIYYSVVEKSLWLIFEFLDQDLRKYLDNNGPLALPDIKKIMAQLLEGLVYMHGCGVLHRDVKPQNVLITNSKIVKFADFGLARTVDIPLKKFTREIQTLWYRAPELMLGENKYSFGVDIWALGCIFAEIVTKKPLFQGDCQIDQIYKIFQVFGTPDEIAWPEFSKLPYFKECLPRFKGVGIESMVPNLCVEGVDLLKKLLALDPKKRISAKEALEHSFFKDIK